MTHLRSSRSARVLRRLAGLATIALLGNALPWTVAAQTGPVARDESPALVEPASPDRTTVRGSRDIALTVSGGVSLGAYQAGYLFLTSQAIKHSGRRLRLLTGASAGSANTLLAAIDSCRPPNTDPTADLGFQTWLGMGFRELFVPEDVAPDHVFSRAAVTETLRQLETIWMQGLPEDCDVVWGATVTRATAQSVRLREGLSVPRVEVKFAVRIRGRGMGLPPRVTNYNDPNSAMAQPVLSLHAGTSAHAGRENFRRLGELVVASSAFPIAFAPQALDYCMRGGEAPHTSECEEPTERAQFIDGGVLDNTPLRYAARLARQGLEPDPTGGPGSTRWRDLAEGHSVFPVPLRHSYLDPDTTSYPQHEADEDSAGERDLFDTLANLLGQFIASARAKELYSLAEEEPEFVNHVFLTRRHFPTVSGLLGAFLGFFEREFRRFDYYLGMFDAYANSDDAFASPDEAFAIESMLASLHPRFLSGNPETLPDSWRPLGCMLGWYLPTATRWRPACEGESMRDFRILVQVSLDRLYAHCSELPPSTTLRGHCARAARGGRVPRVVPQRGSERTDRSTASESDFDHTMRLLATYQFHFRDLGLAPDEAEFGRVKIRRKLLGMLNAIAAVQPGVSSMLVTTVGRAVINGMVYEPPRTWGYLAFGTTIELGVNFLPWEWNRSWLRLHASTQLDGMRTLAHPSTSSITLTVQGGVEFQLLPWTSSLFRPAIGLRGGHRFAFNDHFGRRECTVDRVQGDARDCSQWIVGAFASASIIDRLRAQIGFDWLPERHPFGGRRFSVELAIGVHLF